MAGTEQVSASDGSRSGRQNVALAAGAVRDLLRAELLRGDYDRRALPQESELQRTHGASRGAVRAALELLREEGLVERLRGAGTFVRGQRLRHQQESLHGLDSGGPPVAHEVLGLQVQPAHSVQPALLRIPVGSPVLRLDRRTSVGGEVVGLWTSYLPLPLAAPLTDRAVDLSGDYYDALERLLGRRIGSAENATEAVLADIVVAPALGVPVGSPVLRLERLVQLEDGTPLDMGVGRFRGDRLRLLSTRTRRAAGAPGISGR
jgi:GntR family transcriptional regulator